MFTERYINLFNQPHCINKIKQISEKHNITYKKAYDMVIHNGFKHVLTQLEGIEAAKEFMFHSFEEEKKNYYHMKDSICT